MKSGHSATHGHLRHAVTDAYQIRFQSEPEIIVRAPGRVNMLGSHVDYNEGWVLPAATEQAIWLAAGRGKDGVTVSALDFDGATVTFRGNDLPDRDSTRHVDWFDYPRGVAWALQRSDYEVAPMQAVFAGDIPVGAGVSSSAAVEVAFLTAWNNLGGLELDGLTIAKLGQQTENGYIGLASGIMDQFASVHGAQAQLVMLDCRTLEHELVPLPAACAILVADSGVRRALASSEYNVRREQCEEAVSILKSFLPEIRSLRDVSPREFEGLAHHLPIDLRRRAQHVIEECQRVLQGAAYLKDGALVDFGRLLRHSHLSARDLYEVSVPELDHLAATAWQLEGCYGARLTGAGFGGCVVALVDAHATEHIEQALHNAYTTTFDHDLRIFQTSAAEGVQVMQL